MSSNSEHHWIFGRNCHIEFPNGGEPIVMANSSLNTDEGSASISDEDGNLLFYTDGSDLWDISGTVVASGLGGHRSSANAAIIIPPAGGGSLFHVFATPSKESPSLPASTTPKLPTPKTMSHTVINISTNPISVVSGPAKVNNGPVHATEHLAAVPHVNCLGYWVVSIDQDPTDNQLCVTLVDGDMFSPSTAPFQKFSYFGLSNRKPGHGWCMKFSPSGEYLAVTNTGSIANEQSSIQIFHFDRSTGIVSFDSEISDIGPKLGGSYGLEFSPSEEFLYYSKIQSTEIFRHKLMSGTTVHSTSSIIGDTLSATSSPSGGYKTGALQLGPNGRIYGIKTGADELFVIKDPDAVVPEFLASALDANNNILKLNSIQHLGLPTFTRISDDCIDDECSAIDSAVNEILQSSLEAQINAMKRCSQITRGTQGTKPGVTACTPLQMDKVAPTYHITWGNSRCDCIESDDLEVMNLTICNPYSNISLSNVTVHKLEVVDGAGKPVPTLPDGSPSVTLVPVGPYCFDDISPCTCVTREFTLRLRGAISGPYKILVSGICYDVCFHNDDKACFQFDVCKD